MNQPPAREFGKRKPAKVPPDPPAKRSGHVALLLMGTLAVGGGAYALVSRQKCEPSSPAVAATALPDERCHSGGSSGGGGSGGGHGRSSNATSPGDSSGRSASAGGSDAASSGVTRGGFGSFGHGFGGSGGE